MTKPTESGQARVISDEQIIEMYWEREERVIQETDNKYGKLLFRIAYNILHDYCDCEECQNDTYLGVWNTVPPNRPVVFPAFITQIMRRIAINRYKEKNSKKRIPSELTVCMDELNDILQSNEKVEEEYETKEIGKIISAYVRKLSINQRYIFIERYYFAESVECISERLGISESTVYRYLDKIKYDLKLYLERNGIYL